MTAAPLPAQLAQACTEVRPAVKADAVGGVVPSYVAAPASTQEAGAVLRAAAELGLAVVPRGGGTRLDWGAAPSRCDLIVDTRLLDTVLEHAAGDLVARVQAGVRLDRLAEVLGQADQRLALDPPTVTDLADGAGSAGGRAAGGGGAAGGGAAGGGESGVGTVGGMVATGVAGPLRLRFGTPRDLLIGITIVRADGTVARAGGKVVKNVAGYDIGKLLAGSYGTLGLITEATFRLHPKPPAVAYVSLTCPDAATAAATLLAAAGSALAPAAAELDWPSRDAPVSVAVLLEGDTDGVAERAERMCALLDGEVLASAARSSDAAPPWWGGGAAAAGDGTVLRIGFWAGQLAGILAAMREAAAQAGLDPVVSGSGAAGVLHAALPDDAPAAAVAQFVAALREALGVASADAGGRASALVLHAPPAVRDAVDMWGPVPAVALMRAVKDQFDPEQRLAPGRFAGGI
jgi:glycolate oxidase FAD binding subunit